MIRADLECPPLRSGHRQRKNYFLFGIPKSLRTFRNPFFTERGRDRERQLSFLHLGKSVIIVVDVISRCGSSREKANRENPQIFPIGKYKQYSAKNAQSSAEGIFKSSRVEDFFAKNGKGIASFVCFLYNKGKIN